MVVSFHIMRTEIRNHGKKHLEIRNNFPVTAEDRNRFSLHLWLFIPGSLGINRQSYGAEGFFSDTKCLTRFSPLRMPLSEILNPENPLSPITRINRELKKPPGNEKRILYELRSLANIYSSETSAFSNMNNMERELTGVAAFLKEWRKLHSLFQNPALRDKLREAYIWADESISLTTEELLYSMYEKLPGRGEESDTLTEKIQNMMNAEIAHRKEMNILFLQPESPQEEVEHRIYRNSILKKWSHSVLYLTREKSSSGKRWEHILAGVAAATAMSVAVIATILDQIFFPGERIPWVVIVIIAYIFKDRIKEVLRKGLMKSFHRVIADELIYLVDQATGKKAGKIKSQVQFRKFSGIPREIRQLRHTLKNPFRNMLPEEDVIYFEREFFISNKTLRKAHTRLNTLTDIIRFKLDRILNEMDAPEKRIPSFAFDPPRRIRGKRNYHLYLIVSFHGQSKAEKNRSLYRLTVSRKGIERIRLISP